MPKSKSNIVLSLVDPIWDGQEGGGRTSKWKPTLSLCTQPDFPVSRIELLAQESYSDLARDVAEGIRKASPSTEVSLTIRPFVDIWDFEEVYGLLHDWISELDFDLDSANYFAHMSTGTHVMRICMFLLAEARFLPGRMVQSFPLKGFDHPDGGHRIIDLELSRYDRIAKRFALRMDTGRSFLKSGIATRNVRFNHLIDELEQVAVNSDHPILLTGPTGAGKSLLAQRIYQLRRQRHRVEGEFVQVNCATLKGEGAMSALFGHRKGAFTGAVTDRAGLLMSANKGLLFLDEIGELGLEEQAMLLRAIETGSFYPVGADHEVTSSFQLIAGTNRGMRNAIRAGTFREDLLARIDLWHFDLPGLKDRPEDIEPNLDYEVARITALLGRQVSFNREGRERYLRFAMSADALWAGNFRDLAGSVTRMSTLAPGGRIGGADVEKEILRLRQSWSSADIQSTSLLETLLSPDELEGLDLIDRAQLEKVAEIARESRSMAEAGRKLFARSRQERTAVNDSDRLKKYLARFGLDWSRLAEQSR
jgi:transcriptional regulatory protein RtcR